MDYVDSRSRRPNRHPYANDTSGDQLWRQPVYEPTPTSALQSSDPNVFSAYDRERISNAIKVSADLRLPVSEPSKPPAKFPNPALYPARHPQAPTLAFLNEPHNYGPTPAKQQPVTAKSTFSADDDRSVSIKSKSSTTAGGARILKRVMKELTGGVKEPETRSLASARPKKEKIVTYGRGGAGRITKTSSDDKGTRGLSKSTTSLALAEELKTLKSASSSAVTRNKPAVFDPYLKKHVERGMPISPSSMPTVKTTIHSPPSTSASSLAPSSPPPLSQLRTNDINYLSSSPTTTRGWDGETVVGDPTSASFNVSVGKGQLLTPPPSAYPSARGSDAGSFYSPYPTTEIAPPSPWGRPLQEHGVPMRRPSQQSLRTPKASDPPYGHLPQRDPWLPLNSNYPPPNPFSSPAQPAMDLNALQVLYAGLLASQSQQLATPAPFVPQLPGQTVQQPIIPPQIANNLDGLIAAATAYQQLLTAAVNASASASANHTAFNSTPVDIPRMQPESTRTDSALQSVLASYTMSASNSAASTTSSSSSQKSPPSALSPPPHYRQLRKDQGLQRRGSEAASTQNQSTETTPPFYSANEHTPIARRQAPSDKERDTTRGKPAGPRLATPSPVDPTGLSMEDRIQRARSGLLSSKLSFSSNMTPSPAPTHLSFLDHDSSTGYTGSSSNVNVSVAHSHSESTSSDPSVHSSTSFLRKTLSALSLSGASDLEVDGITRPSTPPSDKEERELAKLERSLVELSFLSASPQATKTKPPFSAPHSSASSSDERQPPTHPTRSQQPNPSRMSRKPSAESNDEYRRRMRMALPPVPPSPPVVVTLRPVPLTNFNFQDEDQTELAYHQEEPRRSESPTLTELDFPMPPSDNATTYRTPGMYKASATKASRRPSAPPPIMTFTGEPKKRESIQRSTGNPRSPHHKLAVGRYV